VLENGEYQRVGETQSRVSNARVVAATNRDLRQEVRAGRFRADLYHRLSVFSVSVPPLRELGEDKIKLLDHYATVYSQQSGVKPFQLDRQSMELWTRYGFPGNVRELRNIVIRLTTKYAGQTINSEQLLGEFDWEDATPSGPEMGQGKDFKASMESARKLLQTQKRFNLDDALKDLERSYVEAALDITHGNLSQAAKLLGIHRTTLYSRMQNYSAAEAGEET
jgi:DNA-binding NtrC family response regulator